MVEQLLKAFQFVNIFHSAAFVAYTCTNLIWKRDRFILYCCYSIVHYFCFQNQIAIFAALLCYFFAIPGENIQTFFSGNLKSPHVSQMHFTQSQKAQFRLVIYFSTMASLSVISRSCTFHVNMHLIAFSILSWLLRKKILNTPISTEGCRYSGHHFDLLCSFLVKFTIVVLPCLHW